MKTTAVEATTTYVYKASGEPSCAARISLVVSPIPLEYAANGIFFTHFISNLASPPTKIQDPPNRPSNGGPSDVLHRCMVILLML